MDRKLLRRASTHVVLLLLAVLFAACSGGQAADPANGIADENPIIGSVTDDSLFPGLPAIPIDTEEPQKASSEDAGQFPVWGKDYLLMEGGVVSGNSLVLGQENPAGGTGTPGGGNVRPLSWGMYKIQGLQGLRPLSLNVQCPPLHLGHHYYLGVANYSDMHWDWFGPIAIPEFQLNLTGKNHQHVTHLGNLYFIIVTTRANVVRHDKSTVVTGPAHPPGRPGCPTRLHATDGEFPAAVHVSWQPGAGAAYYEVWRADAPHPGNPAGGTAVWEKIGETPHTQFVDQPLPPGAHYLYKARAMNPAGHSCWSNIDVGWAAPPPPNFVVEGVVAHRVSPMGPSVPLAGVRMYLMHYPPEILVFTNENGYFRFENVPQGDNIVAPVHPDYIFEPPYRRIHLPDATGNTTVTVGFEGHLSQQFSRLWGFVYQSGNAPGTPGQWVPMEGIQVWANNMGPLPVSFGDETDANGYYGIDVPPDSAYQVKAYAEGYLFMPDHYIVNFLSMGPGEPNISPMNFEGHPDQGNPT